MAFFDNLWGYAGGVAGSLAKVAILGYASKLLSDNVDESSTGQPEVVDKGVRLQLDPDTENKIPVLYGEAYFGGYISDVQVTPDFKKMSYCLTLAETTGTLLSTNGASSYIFHGVYLNNNRVVFKGDGVTVDYTLDSAGNQDISARDLIKVYFYKGLTPIQPSGLGGITPAPSAIMPGWTAGTHPMTNLLYAIVEVTYSRDKGITGLPNCTFHVENSMTLPGDVLLDYMSNTRYGAGIPLAELSSSFIDLNTYCSTGFSYTTIAGSTASGPIEVNGLIDTSTTVLANIEEIAKAGSSWISYDIHAGKWEVVINRPGTSIASFTDSNMIGEISISGTSLTQLNNVANVKYQNTDILDKTDFVKMSIPELDLYQNEPRSSLELSLPFTNQQTVAMKLGLQLLKQARVDKIISFSSDFSYMNLRAGDLIDVTSEVYGFTNKVFRLINVEESQDVNGEIVLRFRALEYDATVYDYDIQEYAVETDDGLLGSGAIGKPDVPTVTKTEQANVPKIVITAKVPSGIVDAVEYWITFDTAVSNDSLRTYIQIGTYRNTTGTGLTENQLVSYTYSGLAQSDFFVKVRGANNFATGPYSEPTGLIAYVPIVVADTVSDTPVSIGGQLMGLGLLTLLNNLDKLFAGSTATGGLWDKIFSIFKDETGVDIVQDAKDGNLGGGGGTPSVTKTYLTFGSDRYPLDRGSSENPETPYGWTFSSISANYTLENQSQWEKYVFSGTVADYTDPAGAYWFTIAGNPTVTPGTGSIKLYRSDGTLEQTVSAGSLTVDSATKRIYINFPTRTEGVDYYISMDEGVVKSADGSISPSLAGPTNWNFHTRTPSPKPKPPITPAVIPIPPCPPLVYVGLITKRYQDVISPDNTKVDIESNIGLKFNQSVFLQKTGTITILGATGTHQIIDLSKTYDADKVSSDLVFSSGDTIYVNPTVDFARGATYSITMTAGCVKTACGNSNAAITTNSWSIDPGPTASISTPFNGGNPNSIDLKYDRVANRSTGTINIKDPSGAVVKAVPITDPAVSIKED